MEIFFLFIGIYFMPIFGFLFIVALLRAIKKIVKGLPYTVEVFWSGLIGLTSTTISRGRRTREEQRNHDAKIDLEKWHETKTH